MPKISNKNNKNSYKKKALVDSLGNGVSITNACIGADVDRTTFYRWYWNDKRFAKAVENAKKSRCVTLEEAMHSTALKGNATMQIFLACNLMPDKYKSVNHQVLTFSKEIEEGKKVLGEAIDDMQKKARKKNAD
jgi:hypothetical protein